MRQRISLGVRGTRWKWERDFVVMTRLFSGLAIFSAAIAVVLAIAYVVAGSVDPTKQFIRIADACYLSIEGRGVDSRLVLFNHSDYGPYHGGIISLGEPNPPRVSGFGDIVGIYYRDIRWSDGAVLWTLSINLFYPIAITSLLPLAWVALRRWRRGKTHARR